MATRALGATVLLLTAACASGPIDSPPRFDPDQVPPVLERARTLPVDTASDRDLAKLVGKLLSSDQAIGLDTETRVAVRTQLERTATELARRSEDYDDLEDLSLSELPARISVPAGLRAARLRYEDGYRTKAVRIIRRLDERYPSHAQRREAGDLLSEIANNLADDKGRRLFLFPYSNLAPGVFEYLSTEYPTHPESDDALVRLADIYEGNRLYDLAIEKHRELVLWAQDSPYRISSELAIPRLRLAALDGPSYGRDILVQALAELEQWLEAYPEDPGRADAEYTLVDCLQRLADNDLVVARFYRRVKSPDGARLHAARGREHAVRSRNEELVAEIDEFLASIDEIDRVAPPENLIDAPIDVLGGGGSADGLGVGGSSGLAGSDRPDELTGTRRPSKPESEDPSGTLPGEVPANSNAPDPDGNGGQGS